MAEAATEPVTDIDAILADLQRQRDQLDPFAAETEARRIAVEMAARASALDNRIIVIRAASFKQRELDAKTATERAWLDTLTTIREDLCRELLSLPNRIYDAKTRAIAQNLELSIKSIDFGLLVDRYQLNTLHLGELLAARGYQPGPRQDGQTFGEMPWFGSIPECERRIKVLEAQRADEQHRLDEALLDDAQRAAKLADTQAKNAQPRRHQRADGSVWVRHQDGHTEEVSEPTKSA